MPRFEGSDIYLDSDSLEDVQEQLIRARMTGDKVKIKLGTIQQLVNEVLHRRRTAENAPSTSSIKFTSKVPSNLYDSTDVVPESSSDWSMDDDSYDVVDSEMLIKEPEEFLPDNPVYHDISTTVKFKKRDKPKLKKRTYIKDSTKKHWTDDKFTSTLVVVLLFVVLGVSAFVTFC